MKKEKEKANSKTKNYDSYHSHLSDDDFLMSDPGLHQTSSFCVNLVQVVGSLINF